jgi:hypothetical protein
MLILPTGGKGTGVEANGSNFPFVQPSPDIQGLLADLWLSHEVRDVALPLRVTSLVGFQAAFDGLPSAAQITIVDANDVVIFNSVASNYHWKEWSDRLRVHEWLFNDRVCRAVQHKATADPVPPWPDEITPINGVLDERASELMPERLLTLSVANTPASSVDNIPVAGEITFINGWNVNIASAPYQEPLRNTTSMTFSADPGGGPGRYPGCQSPDIVIRKIGGVGPDKNGNFTLAAGNCYFVRQPITIDGITAVPTPAMLDLGNDCGPCCDCDAYVNVQRAILNLEAKLRATAAEAEATRDEYTAAVARWNDQKDCRANQALQVTGIGSALTYVDIGVAICNTTSTCLTDVKMDLTVISDPPEDWQVVPGTTFIQTTGGKIPYKMGGTPPVLTATHDAIDPASQGKIFIRVKFGSGLAHQGAFAPGAIVQLDANVKYPGDISKPSQNAKYNVIMT